MSASRVLITCWMALAVLSTGTVALGQIAATGLVSIAILVVAVTKAWLIADGFMELRHAPRLWRWLVLSWAALLATVIGGVIISAA
ncbi:cytochrome C oxidase subunit IV family protein [Pseudomonas fluorescens]|uniref:Cytochrome C oxidase subunit IV family protein n=1 Tax=Pseudomonas fluorescens TaxID=294 RepID=A0A944HFB3_PSEFL|nr:cytochrome C oxidase subunit IV family protein [Pseudomonas fluorescens]MBT2295823.1 cytochrome C oxidase subunit IV family protein [Pseudomonas fluorescens]MBT2306080.1 cytochrome C oxidase subunit IV family protein [Pseudomonas fluorescens]MBT2314563.1 cytochrome C oxidase subunit IV family protein [Pseudomonas fluorescens]MBT2315688.1 cytochrome C oxidase subunit IV family protein [Pseudomonas fluorescens]MBT2332276.1 cytochrome C oxidase subunit IV family protein [Pseudomonas fluorescen